MLTTRGQAAGIRNTCMKASKRDFRKPRQYQQLIKKLFSNEEWNSFQEMKNIPEETSDRMYDFITGKIQSLKKKEENRKDLRVKLLYAGKYLAAACVTICIGLALWLVAPKDTAAPTHLSVSPRLTSENPGPVWQEIRNTNNNSRRVQLPDSSVVDLSPNSSLRYEKGFQRKFRDVFLIGKAHFKVRRDAERPFSVHAGGLKTTALGTSFTINTAASKHRTSVILHTGKIVVSTSSGAEQPVYISKAGAGLIYDPERQTAELLKAPAKPKVVAETFLHREGTAIVMKNIPLPQVIAVLKEAYNVNITAIGEDIGHITYTGTVDPSKEQIGQVLNVICLINGMSLSQDAEQEFILQKSNKQTQ